MLIVIVNNGCFLHKILFEINNAPGFFFFFFSNILNSGGQRKENSVMY